MLHRDDLWFKDAVFYEAPVRSFHDSNGDGIGDFRGMTEKLDYIRDLGVDCIWLLPMYPSPLQDDGYDIRDFFDIHSDYGTLEDFKEFVELAHSKGLRVVADLVMNHTSDQHPWFQESRADPDSPRRDYYVWSGRRERLRRCADHLYRYRSLELDVRSGREAALLASLFFSPAGPELRQSRRLARDAGCDPLLAWARA